MVGETPAKEMRLPEKYRGDFERNLEQLGDLATVYGLIAETVGRPEVAEVFASFTERRRTSSPWQPSGSRNSGERAAGSSTTSAGSSG